MKMESIFSGKPHRSGSNPPAAPDSIQHYLIDTIPIAVPTGSHVYFDEGRAKATSRGLVGDQKQGSRAGDELVWSAVTGHRFLTARKDTSLVGRLVASRKEAASRRSSNSRRRIVLQLLSPPIMCRMLDKVDPFQRKIPSAHQQSTGLAHGRVGKSTPSGHQRRVVAAKVF